MSTNPERKKQQKKTNRRKSFERTRNLLNNKGKAQYKLFVKLDDQWKLAKLLKDIEQVKKYKDEIESARKKGDCEIIEGEVFDSHGNSVLKIPPFKPEEVGPSMSEAARKT